MTALDLALFVIIVSLPVVAASVAWLLFEK